ncbi:MAG: DUF692 domain-containing protein [Pirellulales bacterium]
MNSVLTNLPTLGVGIGFREAFRPHVFRHRSEVDFLEIIADHYFDPTSIKDAELSTLARQFPLVPHGLSLSLGSAEGIDPAYLDRLARLVRRLSPPWWSEHVSFTRAGGREIGHLTPLPLNQESLQAITSNVRIVQARIETPLILENITRPFEYQINERDEADFLTELIESTDTGLLLDVTNLYINSVNHRFDPIQFLHRLPAERIVQLHFVGGHFEGEQLIDSHSRATPEEVWQLMEEVVKIAPVKGLLLERDENMPPFDELIAELDRARELCARYGRIPACSVSGDLES